MSDETLRLVVGGALLAHGLGHGGALGALAWIARFGPGHTGQWLAARSWLMPELAGSTATAIACAAWTLALVGFVIAAAGFWGILPFGAWRGVAVAAAVVSIAGIVAFCGTWPLFNTVAALAFNVAVLVAILAMDWPPASVAGR
jgi:hypothetical protein